jgi:hypothetical protein
METKIVKKDGINHICVDGKIIDTVAFKSFRPTLNNVGDFYKAGVRLFHVYCSGLKSGIKMPYSAYGETWFGDGDYRFENFDRQPLKCYGLTSRLVLGLSLKVLRETKVERPSNIIYVKDGDSLNEYGINAEIVELPGHTNGSIGVDVEEKHLLVGDALDNWVFPGMGHLYYNLEDIKKSYDKIKGLGPRTLYFGHGKPVKQ